MSAPSLPDAIEALYACFAGRPLDASALCTFCHPPERIAAILSTPRRELDAELGRHLLRESADHWGSDDAYRHVLPRLLELLAPPYVVEPLYPLHPFEVLCQRGLRRWPAGEQRAVRDFVTALGDEEIERFLGPAFEPCEELRLEAHCPASFTPRAWASRTGFAEVRFPASPRPPERYSACELLVRAPFAADAER